MLNKIIRKCRALLRLFKMGQSPAFGIWFIIIFGCLSIFILPWAFTRDFGLPSFKQTGPIGDTLNGIAGPFIALFAAILTFGAFWVQFQANKQQRKQFAEQAKDTARQRFENIFYELLKIHRDNVNEMNIEDSIYGRRAFTSFYYEFRYVFFVFAKNYYGSMEFFPIRKHELHELTNISYLVFFFGVGYNSSNVTKELFEKYKDMKFFNDSISHLNRFRLNYRSYKDQRKDLVVEFNGDRATFRIKYQPFSGHTGKLGHYFRHLFQTVKFVDEQDKNIITSKYDYVKTLRAQLSNFEQLLLYYNSLSVLGSDWITNKYMFNYEMVRNIPLPYANFGVKPQDLFKADIERNFVSFEWTEVNKKINSYESTMQDIETACSEIKTVI